MRLLSCFSNLSVRVLQVPRQLEMVKRWWLPWQPLVWTYQSELGVGLGPVGQNGHAVLLALGLHQALELLERLELGERVFFVQFLERHAKVAVDTRVERVLEQSSDAL